MEKERKKEKDFQSDRYQLTINNPSDCEMEHENIKQIFVNNFKTIEYFCMADEKGSCYHSHVFACFSSRVRFSKIKRHFQTAHIESVKGTISENIDYIKKSGKWENDEKHGTKIEGTFEEYGNRPADSRGKRNDMTELYEMVKDGLSNAEILARNQDYILQIDKIDKLRNMLLTEKYRGERRLDIEVTYVYGVTGSGKTRDIYDEYGDKNVYRVTDYQHPFDGYNHCEPVIMFDEFRSSLPIAAMLLYLDIYPIELPARYANRYACYTKVFLVSNWPLEEQYQNNNDNDNNNKLDKEDKKPDKETWNAFLRRIKKVKVYQSDGTVIIYDSVKEYMERDTAFEKVTQAEQLTIEGYFGEKVQGN